jgi:hypothetical protein
MHDPLDEPLEPEARHERPDPEWVVDDEYEEVPADDVEPRRPRLPSRRKPNRRPPPPRHYFED